MERYAFDDRNIRWNRLEGIDHLHYSILEVDETNKIADVLFKFAANQKILLHRHKALNTTFVIQGEHRLYRANGEVKEVRPVGRYTVSPACEEPHREGGGDGQDVIVLFSIRGSDGILYELLDDEMRTIDTLSMERIVNLYRAQRA